MDSLMNAFLLEWSDSQNLSIGLEYLTGIFFEPGAVNTMEPFDYSVQTFKLGVRSHLWDGDCCFDAPGGSSSEAATQTKQTHAASCEGDRIYSDGDGPRLLVVAKDTRVRLLFSVPLTYKERPCVESRRRV